MWSSLIMHQLFWKMTEYPFVSSCPTLSRLCASPRTNCTPCLTPPFCMLMVIIPTLSTSISLSFPRRTDTFYDSSKLVNRLLSPVIWLEQPLPTNQIELDATPALLLATNTLLKSVSFSTNKALFFPYFPSPSILLLSGQIFTLKALYISFIVSTPTSSSSYFSTSSVPSSSTYGRIPTSSHTRTPFLLEI